MTLGEVANEIGRRLRSIFLRDEHGRRPVYGGTDTFQTDPHWRDCVLFYEYFHGDNGAGIGASHQTGWTGLIARVSQLSGLLTPEDIALRYPGFVDWLTANEASGRAWWFPIEDGGVAAM